MKQLFSERYAPRLKLRRGGNRGNWLRGRR
jgi:hypothetical protein